MAYRKVETRRVVKVIHEVRWMPRVNARSIKDDLAQVPDNAVLLSMEMAGTEARAFIFEESMEDNAR